MEKNVTLPFRPLLDEAPHEGDALSFKPKRQRRNLRSLFVLLAVTLVLCLVGGSLLVWFLNKTPAVQYTQAAVTTGNISTTISATGPINARAVYSLNFPVAGQVSEIDVQVGQHVLSGEILAKITLDKTSLQDSINQNQISLVGAQESLSAAQISLGSTQASLSNTQAQNAATVKIAYDQEQSDLAACDSTGTGSGKATPTPTPDPSQVKQCKQLAQDKYAQAQAQAASSDRSAQAQLASAQTQVASASNSLDKVNAQLVAAQHALTSTTTQAILTAPVAATVAEVTGVVGQNTSSGGSSSSAFITLIDTSVLTIAAQVNEADIGTVQVGQSAHFTLAAFPTSTFRGTVSNIALIGQTTSNVVTYTVNLTVDPLSLQNVHLYPGMTATVNITTAQRIGSLLLPASALSFTSTALQTGEVQRSAITALTQGSASQGTQSSQSAAGGSRVILTLVNGKLTPVLITTGMSNGQYVEVLSGLHEGDQVVVSQTGGTSSTSSSTRSSGGGLNTGTFNGGAGGSGGGTRLGGSGG